MRTRAWGGKKFYTRDEQDTEGNDLQCKPEWLAAYLTKKNLALALLITADWYRRTSSRETEHETKQLLIIVQPSGAVTFYPEAPPQILAIVAAIPTESYDLRVRYKAIVNATSSEIATRAKHRARKKSSATTTSRGARRVPR